MAKIFVQVAAYRDPDLPFTLSHLFATAKYPRDIRIAVCNQGTGKDWNHDILGDSRVVQQRIHYQKSSGTCWARSKVQEAYEGEEFTLQIDSHHRFQRGWDRSLFKMSND